MGRFDDVLAEAADKTDAQLSSQISGLTRLKDSEIQKLFPAPDDKTSLLQLLSIVNAATDENTKIAKLTQNISSLAAVSIRLIKYLV